MLAPAAAATRCAKQRLLNCIHQAVADSIGYARPRITTRPRQTPIPWTPDLQRLKLEKRLAAQHLAAARAQAGGGWASPHTQSNPAVQTALKQCRSIDRAFHQAVNRARQQARSTMETAVRQAAEAGDSKRCWARLRQLKNVPARSLPAAIRTPDGTVTADPQRIATTLQQHYARVQDPATYAAGADFDSARHARIEAAVETLRCRTSFSDIGPPELSSPITVQEVAQAASTGLHNHRAPNPLDQIPNELLKYGGPGMYAALTAFFNMQWELECKAQTPGVIRSLHKRGDPTLPNNYRPITLGSAIDKLYNLVLNRRLTAHLERTGGLHDAQNGFRRDRSALDNLFMLSSTLQARKRQRLPTYLFFLDIEKAYDSVWRAGLMWHTWEKGIRGKMFRVLAAMCASPSSIVSHDGCLSPPFTPGMGWEQGDTYPCYHDVQPPR